MIKSIAVSTLAVAMTMSSALMADHTPAELRDYYVTLRKESATALFPSVCEPIKNVIRGVEPNEYSYLSRYADSAMAGFERDLRAKMNDLMRDESLSDEDKRVICAYYAGRSLGGLKAMLDLVDQEQINRLRFPRIGDPLSDVERAVQR